MEKERVKKGEKYFYINDAYHVTDREDLGGAFALMHFNSGNYFATREEAEEMAAKLRAVLNGAEVKEGPDEMKLLAAELMDRVIGTSKAVKKILTR